MKVESDQLVSKIKELWPEIGQHSIDVSATFDDQKNAWIVKLVKDRNELVTHVEDKDANDCLDGIKCVYLGHQIGQFIRAYCLRGDACQS